MAFGLKVWDATGTLTLDNLDTVIQKQAPRDSAEVTALSFSMAAGVATATVSWAGIAASTHAAIVVEGGSFRRFVAVVTSGTITVTRFGDRSAAYNDGALILYRF